MDRQKISGEEVNMEKKQKVGLPIRIPERHSPGENANPANYSGSLNPLLIDHILEKIFGYVIGSARRCSHDDDCHCQEMKAVNTLRLVSKLWMERSTQVIRRIPHVTVFGCRDLTSHADIKLEGFLGIMKTSLMLPLRNYVLQQCLFTHTNQHLLKQFIEICLPHTAMLILDICMAGNFYLGRRSYPAFNSSMLTILKINCWNNVETISKACLTDEMVHLLQQLFKSAVSLKEFHYSMSNDDFNEPNEYMLEILRTIPKSVKSLSLVLCVLSDLHLECITASGIALEKLEFTVVEIFLSGEAVRNFFSGTAIALTSFYAASMSSAIDSMLRELPKLEHLVKLKLGTLSMSDLRWLMAPIRVQSKFPKLSALDLELMESPGICKLLTSDCHKVITVKELVLPHNFPYQEFVKAAASFFPNVKKIKVFHSKYIEKGLRSVFTHFPDIEELDICFGNDLKYFFAVEGDVLLSGVPLDHYRQILNWGKMTWDSINLQGMQQYPSILNLKKLKKLKLLSNACANFTDFSGYFLFLRMGSLENLVLTYSMMTEFYHMLLKNKLKVFYIDKII